MAKKKRVQRSKQEPETVELDDDEEESFFVQLQERIIRIEAFVNTVRRSLRYRYSPTDVDDMGDGEGSSTRQFGSMLEEIKLLIEASNQLKDLYNLVDEEQSGLRGSQPTTQT